MSTIATAGGSGSGNFAVGAAGSSGYTLVQQVIFTTPNTANMTFLVSLEAIWDSNVEVPMDATSTSASGSGAVTSKIVDTTQQAGTKKLVVGPNTAVYIQARNKNNASRVISWVYHYLAIQVSP